MTLLKRNYLLIQIIKKKLALNNSLHKKSWRSGIKQIYVETPLIPQIKIKLELKRKRDYMKIKLRISPTLENSYIYEFKKALFDKCRSRRFTLVSAKLKDDD